MLIAAPKYDCACMRARRAEERWLQGSTADLKSPPTHRSPRRPAAGSITGKLNELGPAFLPRERDCMPGLAAPAMACAPACSPLSRLSYQEQKSPIQVRDRRTYRMVCADGKPLDVRSEPFPHKPLQLITSMVPLDNSPQIGVSSVRMLWIKGRPAVPEYASFDF